MNSISEALSPADTSPQVKAGKEILFGAARDHLKLLDSNATEFTFQVFGDNKTEKDKAHPEYKHGTLDELRAWLERKMERGCGIFVMVNEGDGQGRGAKNVTRVRAVWQDDDDGFTGSYPIAPSFVVQSSPGKFQRYWLADGLTEDDFKDVMARMVSDYGADKNAKDLSRVLRLPGSLHQKDPNNVFRVEVVEVNRQAPYSRQEILAAFPPITDPKQLLSSRAGVKVKEPSINDTLGVPPDANGPFSISQNKTALESAINAMNPDDEDDWRWVLKIFKGAKEILRASTEDLDWLWSVSMDWARKSEKFVDEDQQRTKMGRQTAVDPRAIFGQARDRYGWKNPGKDNTRALLAAGALGEEPQRGDTPEWVADLNERFSVFLYVSKMTVAFLDHDETAKREVWRFINFESFKQMHCSEYAQCGIDKKGNPIMKSKGKGWLEHPQRTKNRTFYFDPSQPPKLEREGYMNLWVGFAVSGSSEGGSPDLMLKHIQEVVCQNDPEKIRYVMGWLAILIKEPGRRHEVALILRGGKGSGKGTLGNLLCRIFGRHGLAVSMSRHLTGNFNDHLLDCCFLFADEAFFAGDRASEGSLKARITEPLITIEPKGLPVFTATNRLSVLMATNSDYVVPASADERRYAVFDMARDRIGDREYFNNLAQWAQKDANVLALIEYFQAYNLTGFEVRDVPGTRELAEQREYSLPMWAQWWKDALARGSFAGDLVWHESVSNAYLYSSYASYVRYRGANQYDRLGDALLGKEINKHELAPKKKRSREVSGTPKGIVGDWASGETLLYLGVARGQVYIRTLGPLEEARRKFIDAFKLPEDLFEEVDDLPTEGQDPPNVKKKKELDYEALSACFDD